MLTAMFEDGEDVEMEEEEEIEEVGEEVRLNSKEVELGEKVMVLLFNREEVDEARVPIPMILFISSRDV